MKLADGRKLDWSAYTFQKMRAENSVIQKTLLQLDEGGPGDFDFTIVRIDTEYYSPRHTHPWPQVRFVLDGVQNYAPEKDLPTGSVSYFPEGVYYGPQNVGPMTQVLLQFGGPCGMGYPSHAALLKASTEMGKIGKFIKGGAFEKTGPDGKVERQDGYKATWEFLKGEPLVYPQPQYSEPIITLPEQFSWKPVTGRAGNYVKELGSFSQGQVELKMVKAEKGARFTQGSEPRRQLLFVAHGEIAAGSASLGQHSAMYTEENESMEFDVKEELCGLVITLPSFPGH
jgi:quercetin dioxygenase-like cupin family protein